MESGNVICDFFKSIKVFFRYLSCVGCIDDGEYYNEMNSGYIYDIQSEKFISPIVNIVPTFDPPNTSKLYEEYAEDDTSDRCEHVEIDIIENYMDHK